MIKQFYKARKNLLSLLIAFAMMGNSLTAQVSVAGPVCIIPGITYQYVVNGPWNSSSAMHVCITGGFLNTGAICTAGTIESSVFVIWNDTSYHRLELTSSSGNINVTVQQTNELRGGEILDSDKTQLYDSTVASYTFRSKAASGGACTPIYSYQWQRSEDALNWSNITGATGKDLQFSGSVLVNTFFRRVTMEINSNTLAYSDTGMLVIPFN